MSAGYSHISTGRSVAFPGFVDSLTAGYSAGTFQAFGEAGYRIDKVTASFEPFANLAYVNLHTDGAPRRAGDRDEINFQIGAVCGSTAFGKKSDVRAEPD